MNFLNNFVGSIGAMDGNQLLFLVGTNVATCGITYYATRKAYEVDDEEDKKPAKDKAKIKSSARNRIQAIVDSREGDWELNRIQSIVDKHDAQEQTQEQISEYLSRYMTGNEADARAKKFLAEQGMLEALEKVEQEAREVEPKAEVKEEPKAEVKEEPKAEVKEKPKAKKESVQDLTLLMAKISAEEMLQKVPKKGWKSEDYTKATEIITQQLMVGLEHDKEALKEAKDKIEQALKANPDMPVNEALRASIQEELKASKIPLEEPLIAFLKENGLPFKDTAKRA